MGASRRENLKITTNWRPLSDGRVPKAHQKWMYVELEIFAIGGIKIFQLEVQKLESFLL